MTVIRFTYTSWQTAFPGRAVDLTRPEGAGSADLAGSADSADSAEYGSRAEEALKLLDLGRRPKSSRVAELLEDIADAMAAADDMESGYAGLLYPSPKQNSDRLWLEFSVYDNREDRLSPADLLRGEVIDPAEREVVTDGPQEFQAANGPALRLLQTTVTPSPDGRSAQGFPQLVVAGLVEATGAAYVVHSHTTSGLLADTLDEVVTEWVRALRFPAEGAAS